MSTVDTRLSRVDRRLSFGQMGVHANISCIDIYIMQINGVGLLQHFSQNRVDILTSQQVLTD